MKLSDDDQIIHKIQAGDSEAYAEIVRKYQQRVIQLCASMLKDAKEAEDAAQEVFVKAFYSLTKFKGDSAFYTWLYRIASNHCLDRLRKSARQKSLSWDALLEQKGDEIERLLLRGENGRQRENDRETVELVLDLLTPEHRLVLTLREIQGLSYQEMTETLHCSLAAVKGRLKRARKQFQEQLRHFLNRESV